MEGRAVLVVPGYSYIDLAIVRSLGRHGVRVIAGAPDGGGFARFSRFCSGVLPLPAESRAQARVIVEFVQTGQVSHLISAEEDLIALLNRERATLEHHTDLLIPPPDRFALCLYKDRTLELARQLGIPVPRTEVLNAPEDVERCRAMNYPLVLKPRHRDPLQGHRKTADFTAAYVRSYEELAVQVERFRGSGELPLVQEYCPGEGIGVEVLMHRGQAAELFQHRRIRENPPSGGKSVLCESVPLEEELVEYSLALLRAMGWEGVAMVEFRRDPATGRTALMEVNGRFWGSLALTLHAGADFPYHLYLAHTAGGPPPARRGYRAGVRCRSLTHDTASLLARLRSRGGSKLAAVRDYLAAFRPGVKYYVWDPDDPLPALAGPLVRMYRLLRRLIKKEDHANQRVPVSTSERSFGPLLALRQPAGARGHQRPS